MTRCSEADRATARVALKNRLGYYAHLLDVAVDQATKQLTLTNLPATAEAGLRMRDELRAAKNKLDAIAASFE